MPKLGGKYTINQNKKKPATPKKRGSVMVMSGRKLKTSTIKSLKRKK